MSLIGNCQSAKAFCCQNGTSFCSENKIEKISYEEAKHLLEEFNHFISKYHQSFQKQTGFQKLDFEGNLVKKNSGNSQFPFSDFQIELTKKTSKIRNKDHLLSS